MLSVQTLFFSFYFYCARAAPLLSCGAARWVCGQTCFESTSILLFLNKRDLFEKKVLKVSIKEQPAFTDYAKKPFDIEDGIECVFVFVFAAART